MEMPPNRLAELLAEADLSKVEVAATCRVGEMTIRRWLKGETAPSDEQKVRMADLLSHKLGRSVSIEYLMGWDRIPASTSEVAR